MAPHPVPEGCQVIVLSPLQIHFSQTRIRSEFQDGRFVDDTLAEITGVLWRPSGDVSDPQGEPIADPVPVGEAALKGEKLHDLFAAAGQSVLYDGAAKPSKEETEPGSTPRPIVMLQCPFPYLEVTKWRCKLREPDGAPKLDPKTGLELYSHEERWFTFDNRRLYVLQRAAAALWPLEVRCKIAEVPGTLARTRELRKFDTRTFGCSIVVGRRDDPDPAPWSWRLSVGLPEEEQPEEGVAKAPGLRWRGGRGGAVANARRRAPKADAEEDDDDDEQPRNECIRNVLLFVMVYLFLRVVLSVFKSHFK
eukprot:CAMPEP_0178446226 /NCGR_PEP_ID=MMETSP0689_2-20121128/40678_1 /TAXON_ID=160604 /ORGANISM="Amphidinium massartii, Strain CS-259" /LENGTH=306 /DNA_ID=CAMNT_0020071011 /DNA_START=97 /DNA_END=1014 /DNA_ORIENTATION=-